MKFTLTIVNCENRNQMVYDELKRQARSFLNRERRNHTLQPTALVHEAYLKMVDQTSLAVEISPQRRIIL